MTGCPSCDELGLQYLLALEEVRVARRELAFSSTTHQVQSARARLIRVEADKEFATQELLSHCDQTGCHPEHVEIAALKNITVH